MRRPAPTRVFHFTRIEHLGTIAASGLQCDAMVQANGLLQIEVGEAGIKDRRARRAVPVSPGGVVAQYVPFYFAPRSPMMSAIANGRVATYGEGTDRLAYLVTSVERLQSLDLEIVLTDRNAVLALADFMRLADGEPPEDFIDWALMNERYWYDTPEYPDRRERRMAECLVPDLVPWSAFTDVVLRSESLATHARALVRDSQHMPEISAKPHWYFRDILEERS